MLRVLIIAAAIFGFAPAGTSAQNEQFWGSSTKQLKGNLKVAERVADVPEKIAKQFSNKSVRVFSIDLDSDGKPDFIVVVDKEFQTCYFDSSFSKRHCEKRGVGDGFSYYYFVQLDDDPMLELFDLSGDEDYSDYKLLKFDPKTWTPSVVFEIQPLIKSLDKSHKGIYWGYPWDITDLPLQRSGANLQIKATFAESPNSNSADEEPRGLKLLFEGMPTQGDAVGPHTAIEKKFQWKSLRQLTERSTGKLLSPKGTSNKSSHRFFDLFAIGSSEYRSDAQGANQRQTPNRDRRQSRRASSHICAQTSDPRLSSGF